MKTKIYVGCSLTHAPEAFKKGIAQVKARLQKQHDVMEFLGLENGTAQDVFEHDTNCVKTCDLFVAECSHPSIGLGYELGTALALNKPILAIADKDAHVSRMVLGISHPKYTFKRYTNIDEVVTFVKEKLA